MKRVLILGATSAIGSETAKLFAEEKAELFLVGRDEKKLKAVCVDLVARGAARVEWQSLDLNDFERHAKLLEAAIEKLGSIDVLLVAHGTLGDQKACERSYAEAHRELSTNFLSIVSLVTPMANYFEGRRAGTIAVIASVAGDRGRQSNYIYGTAKGAVCIFLQGLRNRLSKYGVQVLTIKPGFVDTPMTAGFEKGALFVGPDVIAEGIFSAIQRKKDVVYLPWFWFFIMAVIRNIPERIFKRLKL